MLKAQLWATSDINLINQAMAQGFKVIYLGDPISIDPMYKDIFVTSTALVPDYNTLSLMVDGNQQGFIEMYAMSLNSKPAIEMLSVIFTCLYRGTNIIFFLPPESAGLNFIEYLLQFIYFNYGITTQTKTTEFSFDPAYTGRVIELLYLNNLVDATEFLVHSETLNEITLRKLVGELHPMVNDPTDIKQIMAWFSNFKDELLKAKKPLINGIQYAGNVGDYTCS